MIKKNFNYGNPDPLIVRVVPPPVPPRVGLTVSTVGVKPALYVKKAVCTTLFEETDTVQFESVVAILAAGVYIKMYYNNIKMIIS